MNFLLPLYLLGLAGLALPWALHRFSNQEPEVRAFPSIRFLEATPPPVSRKRKLRYRILFAARLLALLVLCLLFAEPWLNRSGGLGEARRLHIIALDESFSMQAAGRWDRALASVREEISQLPDGDVVRLLSFDTSVTSHTEPTRIAADVMSALNTIEPGFGSGDYGVLMQWLDNMAEESQLPVVVSVITDVQRAALPERVNALTASRLEALTVVDVSQPDQINVSVAADVRTLDDVTARIRVTIKASSSGAAAESGSAPIERTVVISHRDKELVRQRVSLVPGNQESILFDEIPLPAVADPIFTIALEQGDDLPADDALESIVRQPEALSVAMGALSGSVDANAEAFVSTALQTDGEAEVDSSTAALSKLANQKRHAVIFADLNELEELPEELARFLDVGGNALLINTASEKVVAASGTAGDVAHGVGRLDDSHPLALGSIEWLGVRFHELPSMRLEENDRVLIETTGRTPMLVERPTPRGSLLLLNDPLDGRESNLPFHPAFVSLMQNVLFEFARNAAIPEEVMVGMSVPLPGNIQILDPDGNKLLELAALSEAHSIVFERPGLHTVLDSRGAHRLSVILDPREGDLSSLTAEQINAWQSGGTHDPKSDKASTVSPVESEIEESPGRRTPLSGVETDTGLVLWPWLIPILALMMFGESLLANQRLQVRRDGS